MPFFGIGQASYQYKGEQISYEWAKEQARTRDDHKSLQALNRLVVPDSLATNEVWLAYLMTQRQYVNAFGGGTIRNMTGMWPLIKLVLNQLRIPVTVQPFSELQELDSVLKFRNNSRLARLIRNNEKIGIALHLEIIFV